MAGLRRNSEQIQTAIAVDVSYVKNLIGPYGILYRNEFAIAVIQPNECASHARSCADDPSIEIHRGNNSEIETAVIVEVSYF